MNTATRRDARLGHPVATFVTSLLTAAAAYFVYEGRTSIDLIGMDIPLDKGDIQVSVVLTIAAVAAYQVTRLLVPPEPSHELWRVRAATRTLYPLSAILLLPAFFWSGMTSAQYVVDPNLVGWVVLATIAAVTQIALMGGVVFNTVLSIAIR